MPNHDEIPPPHQTWFTRQEAAAYARVSLATIDRAIRKGKLASTKPDGRRLIHRHALDAWLRVCLALFSIVAIMAVCCGCGGQSIEHKVSDYAGTDVVACESVAVDEIGTILSCQTEDRTTVCVRIVEGEVFDARADAARRNIAC